MGDPRLVLIEWEDSHSDGAWQQLDDNLEDRALVCRSVGWLVLDGERAKVVAPHLSEQDAGVLLQGSGVMTIPTRAVLRIVDLQATNREKHELTPQERRDILSGKLPVTPRMKTSERRTEEKP